MSTISPSYILGAVNRSAQDFSSQMRDVGQTSGQTKTYDKLSVADLSAVIYTQNLVDLQGKYAASMASVQEGALNPALAATSHFLTLAQQANSIIQGAQNASATKATREASQKNLEAILSSMQQIVDSASSSSGTQLLTGLVSPFVSTAPGQLGTVKADNDDGATAMNAALPSEANKALQAVLVTTLTSNDKLALNQLASSLPATLVGTTQFYTQAFQLISGIKINSQLYASEVADVQQAMKIGPLLGAVMTGAMANPCGGAGGAGDDASQENLIARVIAALTNQAVLAVAGAQPGAAAIAAGAEFSANSKTLAGYLTTADIAALQAYAAKNPADINTINATHISTADAYAILQNIGCFSRLFTSTNGAAQNFNVVGNVAGILGNTAAEAAIDTAQIFKTANGANSPLRGLNTYLVQSAIDAANNITPIKAIFGPNTQNFLALDLPNLDQSGLKTVGMEITGDTADKANDAALIMTDVINMTVASITSMKAAQAQLKAMAATSTSQEGDYNNMISNLLISSDAAVAGLMAQYKRAILDIYNILVVQGSIDSKSQSVADRLSQM